MKRTPLQRKSPLRAKRWRRGPRKVSSYKRRPRYSAVMLAVKELPCGVLIFPPPGARRVTPCGGVIEADHMGARGVGQKCHDLQCGPLCTDHHGERTAHTGMFKHATQAELREWRDLVVTWTTYQIPGDVLRAALLAVASSSEQHGVSQQGSEAVSAASGEISTPERST